MTSQGYELQLPQFQGPLELLLHLIEERRLDITQLSLLEVTDQYLAYLHAADQIDLDALAAFLVIAARLLLLKSTRLLPQALPFTEEGAADSGAELAQMLRDYQRLQGAVAWLRAQEGQGRRAYAPLPSAAFGPVRRPLAPLTPQDLLQALAALKRRTLPSPTLLRPPELLSLAAKIEEIRQALARWHRMTFQQVAGTASREAYVVAFLALLELLKRRQVAATQEHPFSEIMIASTTEGLEEAGDPKRGGPNPQGDPIGPGEGP